MTTLPVPGNRIAVVALGFAGAAALSAVAPRLLGLTFSLVMLGWMAATALALTAIVLAAVGMARRQTHRCIAVIAMLLAIVTIPGSTVILAIHTHEFADNPADKVPGGYP
ncbi:hypothetical protein [Mycetocola zhujimingii]|uniref:hypothetical protein n=1 Tax=Mycetocola zhujimingii TaxID=2079792 RepID=UPI0013C44645|nr:hypothetical protein [Mycetocola zhujimingii]